VEAHGGKIWIEKTSNGKGAVFVFTLPTVDSRKKLL
jgi:signal transduction histidine kinase